MTGSPRMQYLWIDSVAIGSPKSRLYFYHCFGGFAAFANSRLEIDGGANREKNGAASSYWFLAGFMRPQFSFAPWRATFRINEPVRLRKRGASRKNVSSSFFPGAILKPCDISSISATTPRRR